MFKKLIKQGREFGLCYIFIKLGEFGYIVCGVWYGVEYVLCGGACGGYDKVVKVYSMVFGVLCCAVLCCAVLCCAVLCCAVLCCAVLCCAVLCCAVLCCAVLCCAVV